MADNPNPKPSETGASAAPGETPPDRAAEGNKAIPALSQLDVDRQRLELERYKIDLDYRKFIWGSVFVAIAIAALPPLFQLATALLEYIKVVHEENAKEEEFHDGYIRDFVKDGANQDIEIRIRLADYFANVSSPTFQAGWARYQEFLTKKARDT